MELLGVADAFVWIFELFDLLDELGLGLDVGEHLLADQHLVEDQAHAPDVALLVVLLQLEHLRRCVERSAGALGHLYLHVTSQSEVCDLEFLVLIEEDVIRFEIPVQLFYIGRELLSLLM